MIVVIGAVAARGTGGDVRPDGLAAAIATTAARHGARVEIVARIGDDPAGDAVLLALARGGVGHVAVLRDAARATPLRATEEPATDVDDDDLAPAAPGADDASRLVPTLDRGDVSLALRYLVDFRVIVVVHPRDPGILMEVAAAAGYAEAHLVCVTDPSSETPDGLPREALVVTAADDATGVGEVLGRYAAAVDRGEEPVAAFAAAAPPEAAESGTEP